MDRIYKEFQIDWNENANKHFDLSDRADDACSDEAKRETPLIDCETDLVRFEVSDEISGLIQIGNEDRPETRQDPGSEEFRWRRAWLRCGFG